MTLHGLHKVERLLDRTRAVGLVLGIDTATPSIVLGLVRHGAILAGTVEKPSQSHASSLPLMVDGALTSAGVKLAEVNGIAVGIGPGSFTGVRVALSYVKGLSFAVGCSLVGVCGLDSLAICGLEHSAARVGVAVCALVDARREQFYTALYRVSEDGLEQITPPALNDAASLSSSLAGEAILVGDDAQALERRLRPLVDGRNWVVTFPTPQRRAAALAAIGAARIGAGCADSPAALEPLYVQAAPVRPPQALIM